jgi:uncharacterized membrane protein
MMEDKPFSASGYEPEWAENVRAGCLYLATVLGDLLKENLVIIGGLVRAGRCSPKAQAAPRRT